MPGRWHGDKIARLDALQKLMQHGRGLVAFQAVVAGDAAQLRLNVLANDRFVVDAQNGDVLGNVDANFPTNIQNLPRAIVRNRKQCYR